MKTFHPWLPEISTNFWKNFENKYKKLKSQDFRNQVELIVNKHEQYMDKECVSLNAGANIPNPNAAKYLAASVGSRPSLGYPGNKYEMGMQNAEQLEIMANVIAKKIFRCRYAETRVFSGAMANLYAYMACCKPGDKIMSLSSEAAGHATHNQNGAAGLYGLKTHLIPYDAKKMNVAVDKLAKEAEKIKPRLIIIGASLVLFPYPVKKIKAIAKKIGAYLMFDAAHLSGLIAGKEFQQPLEEGADIMTCSTYKSLGCTPGGLVLTNNDELITRLDKIAYPGMTANFDLSRTAAFIVGAADTLEFGADYAKQCIKNAQTLASELFLLGCEVMKVDKEFTKSHLVAIKASAYKGGNTASKKLEQANILVCGIGLPIEPVKNDFNGIRLGTQEVTRWGMKEKEMKIIAEFIARILVRKEDPLILKSKVRDFRKNFQSLNYMA